MMPLFLALEAPPLQRHSLLIAICDPEVTGSLGPLPAREPRQLKRAFTANLLYLLIFIFIFPLSLPIDIITHTPPQNIPQSHLP